jgi:hypothetical protein
MKNIFSRLVINYAIPASILCLGSCSQNSSNSSCDSIHCNFDITKLSVLLVENEFNYVIGSFDERLVEPENSIDLNIRLNHGLNQAYTDCSYSLSQSCRRYVELTNENLDVEILISARCYDSKITALNALNCEKILIRGQYYDQIFDKENCLVEIFSFENHLIQITSTFPKHEEGNTNIVQIIKEGIGDQDTSYVKDRVFF